MKKAKLITAISLGAVVGLALALVVAYAKISLHGKLPPGTSVAGIDISYQDTDEALATLEKAEETYLNTPIKISYDGKTKEFTPSELGVQTFARQTVKTIEATDARDMGVLGLFKQKVYPQKDLDIIAVIDHEKLEAQINTSFQLKELAPKSASFYFDESSKLAILDGKSGLLLDEKTLSRSLKEGAKRLRGTNIPLETDKVDPAVTREMLVAQEEEIKNSLRHKFALLDPIYSDDWYLKLTDHLDWVSFVQKQRVNLPYIGETELDIPMANLEGENYVAIEIDQDKLNQYIDAEISQWLDRPPEPVNIYKNEEGEITIEGKGSDGRKVQRKLLRQSIETAVANKIAQVPIPVIEITPEVVVSQELKDLGINERIAVGHTSYYGSPANRVHNIKTGASKFNGLLIEPGEVFSFNQNLGAVDGRNGYKKELVIKKEGTIPEYGGGICQVSTTMFRSVLFGGLPVVERNEHSYAVRYYSQVLGDGLDATIYLGGADLKFENNTEQHILIQTFTESDYELYIVFYGTPDGRDVELEGPYLSNYHYPGPTVYIDTDKIAEGQTKQVEKPHTGFNVLWYRHLTDKDGNKTSEPVETRYRAIPAKIWVGVNDNET